MERRRNRDDDDARPAHRQRMVAREDIEWRSKIGQTMAREDGRDPVEAAMEERGVDRGHLWRAFQEAGIAPKDVEAPPIDNAPIDEALAFVGMTPAPLVTYPLEDLLGLVEQPNLPGSIDEHPNWRRRLALPVEEMFADDAFSDRLLAVDSARKRSVQQDNSDTPKPETP